MDKHGPYGFTTVQTTPSNPTTTTSVLLVSTAEWKDSSGNALVVPFNVVFRRARQNAGYSNSEEVTVTSYNSSGITSMVRGASHTGANASPPSPDRKSVV